MQTDVIICLKMAKRGLKGCQNLTYEIKTIKMKKFKLKKEDYERSYFNPTY